MKFYKMDKAFYALNYGTAQTCTQKQSPLWRNVAVATGFRNNETASFFTRSHLTKDLSVIGYFVNDDEPVIAVIGDCSQDELDEFLQLGVYGGNFDKCLKVITENWFDTVKNHALSIIMDL